MRALLYHTLPFLSCIIAFTGVLTQSGKFFVKEEYHLREQCGIPSGHDHHAPTMVYAAMEVREPMDAWQKERHSRGVEPWVLRIGLHSGPVVAGVVGKKKFAYDIWGDTVNTASRMESRGSPGEVNVSGATHELIKEYFECEHRGQVQAKNKGAIDMYFVRRLKPEWSADKAGRKANERFLRLIGVAEKEYA